jgi:hypothetical protein
LKTSSSSGGGTIGDSTPAGLTDQATTLALMPVVRPCLVHRCPNYAEPAGSYCDDHAAEAPKGSSPGTTAAWRRARKAALERAGHRCEKCGRTEQQARADGTHLEVHHVDQGAGGVRAEHHDLSKLRVLCRTPCHTETFRRRPGERRTKQPTMAEIRERAAARRAAGA